MSDVFKASFQNDKVSGSSGEVLSHLQLAPNIPSPCFRELNDRPQPQKSILSKYIRFHSR